MSLHIQMEHRRKALIVRLAGELDHHTAETVRTQIDDAIRRYETSHLIVSLKELVFMDSSGLGVILGRYKAITAKGGKMVLCDVAPSVGRLFEMSGLYKILSVESSEKDALSGLGVAL